MITKSLDYLYYHKTMLNSRTLETIRRIDDYIESCKLQDVTLQATRFDPRSLYLILGWYISFLSLRGLVEFSYYHKWIIEELFQITRIFEKEKCINIYKKYSTNNNQCLVIYQTMKEIKIPENKITWSTIEQKKVLGL